jgi:hypothetical protein
MTKLSLYTALIYGCTHGADFNPEADGKRLADIGREIGVAVVTSYEAEPAYAGVALASSSPRLAREWDVPHLPAYFAVALDGLAALLGAQVGEPELLRAAAAWERLRRHALEKHGLELTEGNLLYVQEYG